MGAVARLFYPWRCLKRGFFLLMTKSFPFRRTILHSLLRFLIEVLTFIVSLFSLCGKPRLVYLYR